MNGHGGVYEFETCRLKWMETQFDFFLVILEKVNVFFLLLYFDLTNNSYVVIKISQVSAKRRCQYAIISCIYNRVRVLQLQMHRKFRWYVNWLTKCIECPHYYLLSCQCIRKCICRRRSRRKNSTRCRKIQCITNQG